MELSYLKEFLTLAEHLNYTRAAQQLSISKDVLSHHITKLEEEAGVTLFNRTTRTCTLTPAGHTFYTYALSMVGTWSSWQKYVSQEIQNHLIIGSFRAMAYTGIADMITSYTAAHGELSLNIIEAPSETLVNMMMQEQCDCAFIGSNTPEEFPASLNDFDIYPYRRSNYSVLLNTSHPLAYRQKLKLKDLKNERLISPPWVNRVGSPLQYWSSAGRNAGLWVSHDLGIAIVPDYEISHQISGLSHVRHVPLDEPGLSMVIFFLHPKGTSCQAVSSFIRHIREKNPDFHRLTSLSGL